MKTRKTETRKSEPRFLEERNRVRKLRNAIANACKTYTPAILLLKLSHSLRVLAHSHLSNVQLARAALISSSLTLVASNDLALIFRCFSSSIIYPSRDVIHPETASTNRDVESFALNWITKSMTPESNTLPTMTNNYEIANFVLTSHDSRHDTCLIKNCSKLGPLSNLGQGLRD